MDNIIVGFTTNKCLCLDLDNFDFHEVLEIAIKFNNKFKLNGFLIVESSHQHYHVIFNKTLTWNKITQYLGIIGYYLTKKYDKKSYPFLRWLTHQLSRKTLTLRISDKKFGMEKPLKIVYKFYSDNGEIENYLKIKNEVKTLEKEINEKI